MSPFGTPFDLGVLFGLVMIVLALLIAILPPRDGTRDEGEDREQR